VAFRFQAGAVGRILRQNAGLPLDDVLIRDVDELPDRDQRLVETEILEAGLYFSCGPESPFLEDAIVVDGSRWRRNLSVSV